MPELYGNPFKWELRNEICNVRAELADERRALWNERKEHRTTRAQRDYAWCKIEELEAKIKRLEQIAQGLITEAAASIDDAAWERFMPSRKINAA